jgi:ATP phosphoribosyltransferase
VANVSESPVLRLALPKGHMQEGVFALLAEAGIHIHGASRSYRPTVSLEGFTVKILKPQNIIEMLQAGSRDIGFAGADWVAELGADVVEVMDTGLDPVRLVAAAPVELLKDGGLSRPKLVVASEYEKITRDWIAARGLDAVFVHTYGATEVFPPEDADCIVDNTASGSTLRMNNLEIIDELLVSTTRVYASPHAWSDPARRKQIDHFVVLLRSVLEARLRVMIELNTTRSNLDAIVAILPCMRKPTISPLYGEDGFAVKAAVPRDQLPSLIARIKAAGGTDIVVSAFQQIVS